MTPIVVNLTDDICRKPGVFLREQDGTGPYG
jgi:hypothetical protein